MGSGRRMRVKLLRDKGWMSMKFPVAPESMSVVVSTVLFFPCSEMGKLMVLLLNGKKTLKGLPSVKIHGSRSGNFGYLLRGFFITSDQNFKDVGLAFSRSLE